MAWTNEQNPFGQNRTPGLIGLASDNSGVIVPVAVDKNTGAILSENNTVPLASSIYDNQQTVTNTAAALSSQSLTQGIIIEALSTNTVSVFVGNSGVTTSNGIELPAGASVTLPINNANLIYVICASSSPVVTWIGV